MSRAMSDGMPTPTLQVRFNRMRANIANLEANVAKLEAGYAELEASRDNYAKRLGDVKVEVAKLEDDNLRLRVMLRRVHRKLGSGMSLAGEVELSKLIIEVLEQGE